MPDRRGDRQGGAHLCLQEAARFTLHSSLFTLISTSISTKQLAFCNLTTTYKCAYRRTEPKFLIGSGCVEKRNEWYLHNKPVFAATKTMEETLTKCSRAERSCASGISRKIKLAILRRSVCPARKSIARCAAMHLVQEDELQPYNGQIVRGLHCTLCIRTHTCHRWH